MSANTIVVVGTGQAGGWAAKTLRNEGYDGRVVLVGDERHPPYERPPLSKSVLAGQVGPETTHLFKPEAWDALALEVRSGERASAIEREAKELVLASGERIPYDTLILCTGGRARTLPIPGSDLPGVFTLRTIEDSLAIRRALDGSGKRLAVVGGGWIGLEVAATARAAGAEVTVIEAVSRLCARCVPVAVSEYLLSLHRTRGVDVILERSVAALTDDGDGTIRVVLDDGRVLAADVVVVGVGLIANDELAREAGIACDGGILVDAQCRTSDPHVFAAGDVAVAPNPWAGRRVRLESWQNAQNQAIAAAKAALGREVSYEPLPWFWSDQYDLKLQIYGLPAPAHQVVIRGEPSSGNFVALYLDGDRVKAAVAANAPRDLRVARKLIEQGKSVRAADLADSAQALATFA